MDIHPVASIRGIYVASQLNSDGKITTKISFDKGRSWKKVNAPIRHANGSLVQCVTQVRLFGNCTNYKLITFVQYFRTFVQYFGIFVEYFHTFVEYFDTFVQYFGTFVQYFGIFVEYFDTFVQYFRTFVQYFGIFVQYFGTFVQYSKLIWETRIEK